METINRHIKLYYKYNIIILKSSQQTKKKVNDCIVNAETPSIYRILNIFVKMKIIKYEIKLYFPFEK